ncbi:hypothetical protein Pcinc_016635 [Petrolisthes cinctipes]|uniref:Reverse transcriptase n=1 Tax=Petrolisthes cinctipes TaxID=88211 RepID=A0AAE1KLQ2_PETCI|nr:hypothetical protein Pcinc_016635 [Petrolisthes cinctipes]
MPKSVDAQHDTILSQLLEACITHVTQRSSSSNTTTIPRDRHPQAIINIIKDQYETVFSTLLPSKVIHDKTSFFNSPIEREEQLLDVNITSHDITNAIKTLKTNSAAGPDLLPAILLKQCALEVSLPLLTFYRESLAFGVVPRLLRSARITPIYKGGSKGEAKNYRLITLTSHLIKTLDKDYSIKDYHLPRIFKPAQQRSAWLQMGTVVSFTTSGTPWKDRLCLGLQHHARRHILGLRQGFRRC